MRYNKIANSTTMNQPTWKFEQTQIVGCKKPVFKVTTPELITRLSKQVNLYWKGEQHDNELRFPGAQPVSIEKKDFHILKSNPYLVCAKLDGERYFVFATKVPANLNLPRKNLMNVTFLVNRRLDFYIITETFSDEVYQNKTLLDGELINNELVIHDIIIIRGEIVKDKTFDIRWKLCDDFLIKNFRNNSNVNTLNIRLKKFYPLQLIKDLFRDIKNNNIKSDGIVFYPVNDKVKYRCQDNLFKWKPPGKHTIDFKIKINENEVELLTWGNRKTIVYEKLPLSIFDELKGFKDNQVIEFKVENDEFIPILIRHDKPVGNNLYTIRKTLLNVRENIREIDLCKINLF